MNWDTIEAIAESLGAVGVIASLVYLAGQIRDGQPALRAGSYQQFHQDIYESMSIGTIVPVLSPIGWIALAGGPAAVSAVGRRTWRRHGADRVPGGIES